MARTIVLIGGRSGIGAALLQRLIQDADTQVWNFSREPISTHPQVIDQRWDARGEFDPNALQLPETIDGLVYCPGSIQLAPFHRIKLAQFEQDLNLNLLGAIRILQACRDGLRASEHASVVLFSSVAVQTGMPMHASIASAKGAVEGLTRSLAAEWAPKIRVNAIAPSLSDTPLASGLLKTERMQEAAMERHPLGRIGTAEDHAGLAEFLLSDQASWMTGQVLHVDGGLGTLYGVSK
jgi:NAD(P)-dependent dehydrogenase (short-subunit alcohol dehydrogenase family)